MWPLNRSPTAAGRSRFTIEPSCNAPRLVRESVSGDRSHQKPSGWMPTAVRQTPFTAMLAPSFMSSSTRRHWIRIRAPAQATAPTSSMIPVNILFQNITFDCEFVGRDGMQPHLVQLDGVGTPQPPRSAGHREGPQAAQDFRRVVKEDLVDNP